ncbi:MAG: hypothetical protein LKK00_00155 [Intestinimonas sp.]|jgi:hypothetical protein|nr:hypothetical protein [Intestinimonas sp.]
MDGISQRFVRYETRITFIHVYSYENRNPKGVLSNPFYPKDQAFDGLIQLLNLIENMLNALGLSQQNVEQRVFHQMKKTFAKSQPAPAQPTNGKPIASFQISVLFRQNASWQGSVRWIDCNLEAQFRSVLELIGLLDSALSVQKPPL